MFDLLEKIRQLNPSKRNVIAFGTTLLFCGVLFVVWLVSWHYTSVPQQSDQVVEQVTDVTQQQANVISTEITPGQSITSGIGEAWETLTSAFNDLKNLTKEIRFDSQMHYSATSTAGM